MNTEERAAFRLDRIRRKCEQPTVEGFMFFVRYFFKKTEGIRFRVNDHHIEVAKALLRCYHHKSRRLVINIPPRYGKTELAVIMFIAWSLMQNTRAKFIHLSSSDELALDNSGRVQELIESDFFQELWPIQCKKSSKAKSLWKTQDGGGLKAGAAGGNVIGFGAGAGEDEEAERGFGGAMIIDDPLKPDDEESDAIRKFTNKRMNRTIKSRLNSPSTPIIMIMQRLHDDDPAGFVLNGGTGEEWEHVKIPVIRPSGEPLWPFRHKMEDLLSIQVADRHVWNGQYMQEPIPDEGDFFTADNARWYTRAPEHLNYYGASDYAASDHTGADYTEHGIFGVCPAGNVYIVDWWSGQAKTDVWIEEQIDLIAQYQPLLWGGETGPIKAAIEPWLTKRMRERRTYVALRWANHSTANYKVANARSFQGLWEHGRVYLPEGKEWAQDLLRQLTRFPLGTLDDKVDTCSIFARLISEVWAQDPPKKDAMPEVIGDQPLRIGDFEPTNKEYEW